MRLGSSPPSCQRLLAKNQSPVFTFYYLAKGVWVRAEQKVEFIYLSQCGHAKPEPKLEIDPLRAAMPRLGTRAGPPLAGPRPRISELWRLGRTRPGPSASVTVPSPCSSREPWRAIQPGRSASGVWARPRRQHDDLKSQPVHPQVDRDPARMREACLCGVEGEGGGAMQRDAGRCGPKWEHPFRELRSTV